MLLVSSDINWYPWQCTWLLVFVVAVQCSLGSPGWEMRNINAWDFCMIPTPTCDCTSWFLIRCVMFVLENVFPPLLICHSTSFLLIWSRLAATQAPFFTCLSFVPCMCAKVLVPFPPLWHAQVLLLIWPKFVCIVLN